MTKMRLQQVLLASVLTFISFVVAGDADRWTTVAQKTRTNVIVLNDQTFDELITTERNYTSVGKSIIYAADKQLFSQHWQRSINVLCVGNLILNLSLSRRAGDGRIRSLIMSSLPSLISQKGGRFL